MSNDYQYVKVTKERQLAEKTDWMALRARFFAECVESDGQGKRKISYAPHDLFEWFKKQLFAHKSEKKEQ